jgi:hypothetical protein
MTEHSEVLLGSEAADWSGVGTWRDQISRASPPPKSGVATVPYYCVVTWHVMPAARYGSHSGYEMGDRAWVLQIA